MKRHIKLHPHRHTGKLLHHRHTSYMALVFVMIVAGLCMTLTQSAARAADLVVTATVPAPIPTGAPIFTYPSDGYVTEDPTITFEGICPVITPAVIIALYEGPTMLGSGPCLPDGTFSVSATLSEGPHSIVATVVTITGDHGDSSTPVTVAYKPKVPPPPVTPPTTGTPTTPRPTKTNPRPTPVPGVPTLEMTSEKEFVAFGLRSAAVWRGYFAGGVTPYQVSVDWGDGTITHYDTVGTERQSFAHAYDEQHSYTIRVTVKDKDGRQLTREYAAVSMTPSDEATGIGTTTVKLLFDSAPFMLALYALLFVIVLWLWRYEILHHGGKSYRALHYSWQKAYTGGKNRHHTPRNHA